MPPTDDERMIPSRLAITVFFAVIALIAIVLAIALIPDAKRPTIRQAPHTRTTTIIIPAPTSP